MTAVLILLLTMAPMGWLQAVIAAPRHQSIGAEGSPAGLTLTTREIARAYCDGGDPDLVSLELVLAFHLTNSSPGNIITERFSPVYVAIRVAATAEAAKAGTYEQQIHVGYVFEPAPKGKELGADPSLDTLLVLKPGESYDTTDMISLPIPRTRPVRDAVAPGKHYISVLVWTWFGDQKTAERLAAQWQGHGKLLYDSLWTEPMSIEVPSQPMPENCEVGITQEKAVAIAEERLRESGANAEDYNWAAVNQGPVWHVTFERRDRLMHGIAAEYCVDKRTATLVFIRQPR
jgi:hypothetical protein